MTDLIFGISATEDRSNRASPGHLINCIREVKGERVVLYKRPGIETKVTTGSGPCRGEIVANGKLYQISRHELYEVDTSWADTSKGSLQTFVGECTMSFDGTYIVIADGTYLYTYNVDTGVLTKVADQDLYDTLGSPTHTQFSDGYHWITGTNTGKVMTHEVAYDPTSGWNSLDYITAEFAPDNNKGMIASHSYLYFFGDDTTEIWQYDGNADPPLSPIRTGYMQFGCVASYSPVRMDNTVFWLGKSEYGGIVAVKANGFTPQIVSTPDLHAEWATYSDVSDAHSSVWFLEGHSLWVISFPTADKTWVFDASQPQGMQWAEFQRYNKNPTLRGRIRCHHAVYFNNEVVTGDWENGKTYRVRFDLYDDDGATIHWEADSQELWNNGEGFELPMVELFMETGVGVTSASDDDHDPQVGLKISKDHGNTWNDLGYKSYGKKGEYTVRPRWFRMGRARQAIFKAYGSNDVKTVLVGGYVGNPTN